MASTTEDIPWAKPLMRVGYIGRAATYAAVAGLSLWAIWAGGGAQGTGATFSDLAGSPWGVATLIVIAFGLFAYMAWRIFDGVYDLEDEGSDGKGKIARAGMVVTGVIHGALGLAALGVLIGSSGGSGGGIPQIVGTVLGWPGGPWIVAVIGLVTMGAGGYYLMKAWKQSYRQKLRANRFTRNWNTLLRIGVAAQGVIVAIAGFLLLLAGLNGNPQEAGGMGRVFEFLAGQPFGNIIVITICVGLLGFALFCFVNALYRIIPKVADDGIESLADKVG
ncbi:MAG: DUF1206 domain-containing protein [Shimia sp.]